MERRKMKKSLNKLLVFWKKQSYLKKIILAYLVAFIFIYLFVAIPNLFLRAQMCYYSGDDFEVCSKKEHIENALITWPHQVFTLEGLGYLFIPETNSLLPSN